MSRITILIASLWALNLVLAKPAHAAEKDKPITLVEPIVADEATNPQIRAKIRAKLNEPTELDFSEASLQSVVDDLVKRHSLPIQIDINGLEEASIGPDTPVTIKIKGVSLRSALRIMLGRMDLTYVIKNEVLMISTPEKAALELYTEVYPVGDLAESRGALLGGEDFESLTAAITSIVAPTSWDDVGGPGAITAVPKSRSLVISQTEEVHDNIANLLAALRKARDRQPDAPEKTTLGHAIDRFYPTGADLRQQNRNKIGAYATASFRSQQ